MKIILKSFVSYVRLAGMALCGALLLFSCSKSTDNPSTSVQQLVLTASALDIDKGEEVTFEATADGKAVDADIYIDNQKITGKKHTFATAGSYKAVAKKDGYTDSDDLAIEVYNLDIYVAGSQRVTTQATSIEDGMVWKNGELLYKLDNEGRHMETTAIAVHHDDIYVTARANNQYLNTTAKYWKNSQPVDLTDGTNRPYIYDIAFANEDIYIIGTDANPHIPIYWRNHTPYRISSDNRNRYAHAIATRGSNAYIVGSRTEVAVHERIAVLWINDREIDLTNGLRHALATDVAVENEDIYVLGVEYDRPSSDQDRRQLAKYWKNGTPVTFAEERTSSINPTAIAVQDGDVYACGNFVDVNSTQMKAVVWKNGERLYELTDGMYNGAAYDIAISGKDIYVVGSEMNSTSRHVAKVWKNGQLLYELTDGARNAKGVSVALVRKK